MDTKNKVFTVIGTMALLSSAGIGGYVLFATKDSDTPSQTISTSPQQVNIQDGGTPSSLATSSSTSSTAISPYKDGTYTASTTYRVPHGTNTYSGTVIISNGTIVSVSSQHDYTDRESGMYTDSFDSGLTSSAKGQSLASYSPSRIGGASLTTAAFSSVLDTIRTKAST